MADISIIHGLFVIISGILLILVRSWIRKYLKAVHITLGVLTSIYGLLTYIVTP